MNAPLAARRGPSRDGRGEGGGGGRGGGRGRRRGGGRGRGGEGRGSSGSAERRVFIDEQATDGGGGRGRGRGGGRTNNGSGSRHKRRMPQSTSSHKLSAVADSMDVSPSRKASPIPSTATTINNAATTTEGGKKLAHITDKRFADLQISHQSRRALAEVFKYEYMTAVQAETLPLILQSNGNKDCLAKAKTGTGKTLAFMIPTIERITSNNNNNSNNNRGSSSSSTSRNNDVNCLVISPTRELAQQITTETEKLLTYHTNHLRKVVTIVGGTNKNKDNKALQGITPIIVATPGRLLDHLQNSDLAARMTNLDCLILDEADQLLDMGFRPDIERILRLLLPSKGTRQTLLFSATIPDQVNEIANIALRPNWNYVDTVGEDSEQTHMHVQQQLMITSQDKLIHNLFCILDRETSAATSTTPAGGGGAPPGNGGGGGKRGGGYKIIVFFTTARLTGFMSELFNSVSNDTGYTVLEIHSRKAQTARERASDQFRKASNAVMFSSDVSARGMDYPDVTFVLQIGLTDRSQYIHRLGRTARAGKDGKGGLLLTDYEEYHMKHNELHDMPLELMPVPIPSPKVTNTTLRAIRNVSIDKGLRNSAEQAYRAWLGYYNGQLKKVRWDKKKLVEQANLWASEIGLTEQPSIEKKTVGKMGLKGVPGLKLV